MKYSSLNVIKIKMKQNQAKIKNPTKDFKKIYCDILLSSIEKRQSEGLIAEILKSAKIAHNH